MSLTPEIGLAANVGFAGTHRIDGYQIDIVGGIRLRKFGATG